MTEDQSPRDQRQHPRMPFETMVAMIFGGRCTFESSAQIGEGGMLLRVFEPVPVHAIVELNFKLPNGVFISATGEVLYTLTSISGEQFMGIRFVNPDDQYKTAIRELVLSAI